MIRRHTLESSELRSGQGRMDQGDHSHSPTGNLHYAVDGPIIHGASSDRRRMVSPRWNERWVDLFTSDEYRFDSLIHLRHDPGRLALPPLLPCSTGYRPVDARRPLRLVRTLPSASIHSWLVMDEIAGP